MFFGKHLFTVLDIEGSNILTRSPTTALENIQLSSIVVTLSCSNFLLVGSISRNPLCKVGLISSIKRRNHMAPLATQLVLVNPHVHGKWAIQKIDIHNKVHVSSSQCKSLCWRDIIFLKDILHKKKQRFLQCTIHGT